MTNTYCAIIHTSNVLQHHGIKGQKWGVRRYQNEDGTLTEAGRKRYFTNGDKPYGSLRMKSERNNRWARKWLKNADYTKSGERMVVKETKRLQKEFEKKLDNDLLYTETPNEINRAVINCNVAKDKYEKIKDQETYNALSNKKIMAPILERFSKEIGKNISFSKTGEYDGAVLENIMPEVESSVLYQNASVKLTKARENYAKAFAQRDSAIKDYVSKSGIRDVKYNALYGQVSLGSNVVHNLIANRYSKTSFSDTLINNVLSENNHKGGSRHAY